MRRLGPEPLTGAQKQRRHRERVKARLAEAEILRARLRDGGETFAALGEFYEAILADLGAKPEESAALCENLDSLLREMQDVARHRAENDLAVLRAKRRKAGASLLSRLAAIKPEAIDD